MDPSLIPKTVGGWLGWATAILTAIITGFFLLATQWRKSKVDETGAAFAQWKQITDSYHANMTEIKSDLLQERELRKGLEREFENEKRLRRKAEQKIDECQDLIMEMGRAHSNETRGLRAQVVQLQRTLQEHGILVTVAATGSAPETGNRRTRDIIADINAADRE